MAEKDEVYISSVNELKDLLETSFSDISKISGKKIEFDKNLFVVKLKVTGEKYDATITTSVMQSVLDVQKCINDVYRQYLGRNLTREEKQQLEIVVKVEKGCSDIVFSILDQLKLIETAVNKMTGDQVYSIAIVGIVAVSVVMIAKKTFDHFDKKGQRALEVQKETVRNDHDKMFIDALRETTIIAATARQNMMSHLKNIEADTTIELNGEEVRHSDLVDRTKVERPRVEPEKTVITGKFRINKMMLNFKDKTAKADIYDVATGDPINGLILQPKSISDGSYSVLKKAQDNNDVDLQIIVTKKNDIIIEAVLDKIM